MSDPCVHDGAVPVIFADTEIVAAYYCADCGIELPRTWGCADCTVREILVGEGTSLGYLTTDYCARHLAPLLLGAEWASNELGRIEAGG